MRRYAAVSVTIISILLLAGSCAPVRNLKHRNDAANGFCHFEKSQTIATSKAEEEVPHVEAIPEPAQFIEASTRLNELQEALLATAKSKLGCRYSYGAKGPDRFDCSGFTGYVFAQHGIKLAASSRDQYLQGRALKKDEPLHPCDLVFFSGRAGSGTVGHVGMVVDYNSGDGTFRFIHASTSLGIEIQKSTSQYYSQRYLGARRILTESGGIDK